VAGVLNPKLIDSGIIDCIPQIGQCPINCDNNCFYNSDGFFTGKKEPLVPTLEEVGGRIVRVNSGHDSNIQKLKVLEATRQYPDKFYNTSIPNFDFPGPVVFTCNSRDTNYSALIVTKNIENLMMVRFRTNTWNLDLLKEVIDYYAYKNSIPVTLTFMRYKELKSIPESERDFYELSKNVTNSYYMLKPEYKDQIMAAHFDSLAPKLIGRCGSSTSNFCKDCGRCIMCYKRFHDLNKK